LNPSDFDTFYQNVRALTTKCSGFKDNIYPLNHKIYSLTKLDLLALPLKLKPFKTAPNE
jgi:hypothetical protein